jgi:hypothetical protein
VEFVDVILQLERINCPAVKFGEALVQVSQRGSQLSFVRGPNKIAKFAMLAFGESWIALRSRFS